MNIAKRANKTTTVPFDEPLDVDDVPELHAARLLILIRTSGTGTTSLLRGRTKLAKLDFFVRYPHFLELAIKKLAATGRQVPDYVAGTEGVESRMIRYKFGPWDRRYRNLLSLLAARGLIHIGSGNVETYSLTPAGQSIANNLMQEEAFQVVVLRCSIVAEVFGNFTGTDLKEFVYATFVEEVANVPLGEVINSPKSLE